MFISYFLNTISSSPCVSDKLCLSILNVLYVILVFLPENSFDNS